MVDEMCRNAEVLSASALSADRLIVEQHVDGEEYAADVFLDANGDPVLTSTYRHPMPANPAYLHMVYYSSRAVMDLVAPQAMEVFRALNDELGATNLAMHSEFRLEEGRLIPIEINSMHFGGMGLGNMASVSYPASPRRGVRNAARRKERDVSPHSMEHQRLFTVRLRVSHRRKWVR
jgi:hypothetical protein